MRALLGIFSLSRISGPLVQVCAPVSANALSCAGFVAGVDVCQISDVLHV